METRRAERSETIEEKLLRKYSVLEHPIRGIRRHCPNWEVIDSLDGEVLSRIPDAFWNEILLVLDSDHFLTNPFFEVVSIPQGKAIQKIPELKTFLTDDAPGFVFRGLAAQIISLTSHNKYVYSMVESHTQSVWDPNETVQKLVVFRPGKTEVLVWSWSPEREPSEPLVRDYTISCVDEVSAVNAFPDKGSEWRIAISFIDNVIVYDVEKKEILERVGIPEAFSVFTLPSGELGLSAIIFDNEKIMNLTKYLEEKSRRHGEAASAGGTPDSANIVSRGEESERKESSTTATSRGEGKIWIEELEKYRIGSFPSVNLCFLMMHDPSNPGHFNTLSWESPERNEVGQPLTLTRTIEEGRKYHRVFLESKAPERSEGGKESNFKDFTISHFCLHGNDIMLVKEIPLGHVFKGGRNIKLATKEAIIFDPIEGKTRETFRIPGLDHHCAMHLFGDRYILRTSEGMQYLMYNDGKYSLGSKVKLEGVLPISLGQRKAMKNCLYELFAEVPIPKDLVGVVAGFI